MAVADGKIVAVGPELEVGMEAAKVIDASGKHVMPGWTDIHTHYDTQCMWDPQLLPSGPGGVTSASASKSAPLYLRAILPAPSRLTLLPRGAQPSSWAIVE